MKRRGAKPTAKQMPLPTPNTWGGKRRGSGRKATGKFGRDAAGRARPGVRHQKRRWDGARIPLHVTVRALPGAPSLRSFWAAAVIGALLKRRAERALPCRVVHFSLQKDHLHMLVEADDQPALSRGMQGLLSGLARVINRATGNRGKLWSDRYHARSLRTPTEVRHCIVYVLRNHLKHGEAAASLVDPLTSAAWFDGFANREPLRRDAAPVAPPATWLLRAGWHRAGGPIRDDERPAASYQEDRARSVKEAAP